MKVLKIASLLLFICFVSFGQTSVPNTETFSLQDIYNAVHAHTSGTQTNLQSCFDNAISGYFDHNYNTNSYAPANSMLRFRNYKPTGCSTPAVTTASISNIKPYSASGGGNVTSDGGCSLTARGICWSTSSNPTTSDYHTTDGSVTGSFTSSMTGLTCGATYHVRAYATNSQGTSYGSDVSFTTSESALNLYDVCFIVSTSNCGNITVNSLATAQTTITYLKTCTISSLNYDSFRAESVTAGQNAWSPYSSCTGSNRTWSIYTTGSFYTPSSNFYIVNISGGVIQSVTLYP